MSVSRKRAQRRLLLVAAVFAAPVVAAYLLYFSGWRPQTVNSYGEFVVPVRPLADVELASVDGGSMRLSALRPHWLLVYFGSRECTSACERALYVMRQVIAAQGKQAPRLRSVMVATDGRGLDWFRYQIKDYPDTTVLTGKPENVTALAREFELPAGSPLAGLHRIYVVDPLGNLMMSYPADADPSGIRKDIARLLRASQVG